MGRKDANTVTQILVWLLVCQFRLFPDGRPLEITQEHELGIERDTVVAVHWHKVENKWYVITKDSTELWVDKVKELKIGK